MILNRYKLHLKYNIYQKGLCMSVGSNIRKYRKLAGLSGAQLGEIIGISQSNLVRYENGGVKTISQTMLERIASALSCSVEDLTAGDYNYQSKTKKRRKPSEDDYLLLEQYHALDPDLRNIVDQILRLSSSH